MPVSRGRLLDCQNNDDDDDKYLKLNNPLFQFVVLFCIKKSIIIIIIIPAYVRMYNKHKNPYTTIRFLIISKFHGRCFFLVPHEKFLGKYTKTHNK